MSNAPRLIASLTVVCVVSAFCLSVVNGMTKTPIHEQERLAKLKAVRAVLPEFDNDPISDTLSVETGSEGDSKRILVYVGKKNGSPSGIAFEALGEGYGGMISMVLGIDVNGQVSGVHILKHAETPGLGSRINEPGFRQALKGKSLANSKLFRGDLAVKKDGGDIDAIAGATISSRGVTTAVSQGLRFFEAHKAALIQ